MKRFIIISVAIVLILAISDAQAGLIIQEARYSGWQIQGYSPIGQTFTAEDPHVKIAFWIDDWNAGAGPIDISIELFEGAGTTGTSSRSGIHLPIQSGASRAHSSA